MITMLRLVLLVWMTHTVCPDRIPIHIDTHSILHTTEKTYLNFDIDSLIFQQGWGSFNFSSPKLRALMRGLSPAILRIGGAAADHTVFNLSRVALSAAGGSPPLTVITANDWDNLVALTSETGLRLLYDLNLQLRYGKQWDPADAIRLLDYSERRGYGGNLDWQLGNEVDLYPGYHHWLPLTAEQQARAFVSLRHVLSRYPNLRHSRLVGPDVAKYGIGNFSTQFLNIAGGHIDAYTFHHYYFSGPGAKWQQYVDPKNFIQLENTLNKVWASVQASQYPLTPVWLGETSDAHSSGTPHVSDRFVSGFLWLDKLGLCAQSGVRAVMRQTFYRLSYALIDDNLDPNPDYWLSYVFRRLVGSRVLHVTMPTNTSVSVRVYAHCATEPLGAVTVFALNVDPVTSHTVVLPAASSGHSMDLYVLTAPQNDMLSKVTELNGRALQLVNNVTLPRLIPSRHKATAGVTLPPLSLAFAVLPKAQAPACL